MNIGEPYFNPFPGLRPFSEQDDRLFFGRDAQVDELLDRLQQTRFVGVIGTSGSGKSSLVRAGLIPALHGGSLASAGSPNWEIVIARPGSNPIANLASALAELGPVGDASTGDVNLRVGLTGAVLGSSALGLVEVVRQTRGADTNLLVVIDQFEEIFRFARMASASQRDDEAVAFVRLLLAAVAQRETPIYVLITMRSDFLGDCARFHDFPEALNRGLFLVPRLSREQLREAIEGPIAVAGASITPRLVNALLEDVGDDPKLLPVLQHALMRTFDVWADAAARYAAIDLQHYDQTGRMSRALDVHGEEIYFGRRGGYDSAPRPTPAETSQRTIAEHVFKLLTEKGPDERRVRRPTTFDACVRATGALGEPLREVVGAYRARRSSFLMPPMETEIKGDTVLDISHESLMANWTRLRKWIDEEAASGAHYTRLATSADMFASRQTVLWRGPELAAAVRWKKRQQPKQGWAERYDPHLVRNMRFLAASKAERLCRRLWIGSVLFFIAAITGLIAGHFDNYPATDLTLTQSVIMIFVLLFCAGIAFCATYWLVMQIRLRWLVWKIRSAPRTNVASATARESMAGAID